MKLTVTSALLCLAAAAAASPAPAEIKKSQHLPQLSNTNENAADHRHHEINAAEMTRFRPMGVMRHEGWSHQHKSRHDHEDHEESDHHHDDDHEEKGNSGKKNDAENKDGSDKKDDSEKKGGNVDKVKDSKKGGHDSVAAPAAKAGNDSAKTTTTPGTTTMPTTGKTSNTAPLWLVQPFGASVWEQGVTYVISWGPNPDPVYAKSLKPNTPIDVRLLQGPYDNLHEIAVLNTMMDSSLNSLTWTVPATLTPAHDYAIRLSHEGDLDTYSHYFEIVVKGDARSTKSNVGEPLKMPQMTGDVAPLTPLNKPAAPPNPFPVVKTNPVPVKPAAAKPAMHSSASATVAGESRQGANMMALAMALFGAVYFL